MCPSARGEESKLTCLEGGGELMFWSLVMHITAMSRLIRALARAVRSGSFSPASVSAAHRASESAGYRSSNFLLALDVRLPMFFSEAVAQMAFTRCKAGHFLMNS